MKRSLLTDGRGIPIGLAVAGANRHDSKLVRETLDSIPIRRTNPSRRRPQRLFMDAGYIGKYVDKTVQEYGYIPMVQSRKHESEQQQINSKFQARRWVVERSHSWMNRFRSYLRQNRR